MEGSPQPHDLQVLSALGDVVPAWAWSRWICDQGHRIFCQEAAPLVPLSGKGLNEPL